MSLRAMLAVFEHSRSTLGARLVLLAIAEYAHDDGTNAFPKIGTIAKKAKLTDRGVQHAVVKLIQMGELEKQERPIPGAKNGTNVYRVILPGLGEKFSPTGCKDFTLLGEKISPDPLLRSSNRQTNTPPTPKGVDGAQDYEPSKFEAFWRDYPRKTAKLNARKSWNKLRPDAPTRIKMRSALHNCINSEQWERGIIPHAATWINQRRWEDEAETQAHQ